MTLSDEIGKFYELDGLMKGLQTIHAHDILYQLRRTSNLNTYNDVAILVDSFTHKTTDEKYHLYMENIDEIYIGEVDLPNDGLPNLNTNANLLETFRINKTHLVKGFALYADLPI